MSLSFARNKELPYIYLLLFRKILVDLPFFREAVSGPVPAGLVIAGRRVLVNGVPQDAEATALRVPAIR